MKVVGNSIEPIEHREVKQITVVETWVRHPDGSVDFEMRTCNGVVLIKEHYEPNEAPVVFFKPADYFRRDP